ncbi:hypothetical protein DPMN_115285 [Dreissena polymorpha]|uniref:Uncharacterized protein n=1 Tax=Dreissena polymorpha TaxID=45954 RepID=A0A9D4KKX4_DREPO|nr:hypothetical protein DPMN_115285 [Dreissena polymorpha]
MRNPLDWCKYSMSFTAGKVSHIIHQAIMITFLGIQRNPAPEAISDMGRSEI